MPRGVAGSSYFQWNYSSSTIIKRKGFGKDLNEFFAKTLYEYAYPFTPYDALRVEGAHMADNVRIFANEDHGSIVYQSKYAKRLHEGSGMHFQKTIHPLATSHWEQAAWRQAKNRILDEVDDFRKRCANNGG